MRDPEPALRSIEELRVGARHERRVGGTTLRHDDARRRRPLSDRAEVDGFPRPDGERDQVRRQRPRLGEANELHAVADVGLRHHGRVRKRGRLARNAQPQPPWRLVRRLVEAGKRPPCARRLELRHRVPRVAVLQREDPVGRVSTLLGLECQRDPVQARRQRRIEREPDELIVSCDDPRLRAVGRDGRARDVNVVCVEPQHVVRPRHRDVDGYLARDLRLTGDDRQGRFVAKRSRALRQPQRRWREGRRRGRLRERSARGQRERAGEDAQPRRRQSSGEHMITASGP